jgi:hypothetical protein
MYESVICSQTELITSFYVPSSLLVLYDLLCSCWLHVSRLIIFENLIAITVIQCGCAYVMEVVQGYNEKSWVGYWPNLALLDRGLDFILTNSLLKQSAASKRPLSFRL